MVYVQYFHKGCISGNLIPACGDRAVVVLDGRNTLRTWKQDAIQFNGVRRPVYDAYQILQGESFTRSEPVTGVITLTETFTLDIEDEDVDTQSANDPSNGGQF